MNFFDDDFKTSLKQKITNNIRLYCYGYAAASCFIKQQFFDCSSNDLTSLYTAQLSPVFALHAFSSSQLLFI